MNGRLIGEVTARDNRAVSQHRTLRVGIGGLVVGLAIFALPAELEGPVLLPISPGHAIASTDAVAAGLVLISTTLLYLGLWRGRVRLAAIAQARPGRTLGFAFAGGTGLGLLLASAFSTFWWWWAIGAALYGAVLLLAVAAVGRAPRAAPR